MSKRNKGQFLRGVPNVNKGKNSWGALATPQKPRKNTNRPLAISSGR